LEVGRRKWWRCPSAGRSLGWMSLVERGRGGRVKRDQTKKDEGGGVGNEKKKEEGVRWSRIGRGEY